MSKLLVTGRKKLDGEVEVQGAKNSALPIIAASILTKGENVILSEIQAMGKPAILIPSPNVAENHQYHNAMALVNAGAADIIEEKDLTGAALMRKTDKMLLNPEKLEKYSENSRKMAITDANERIYSVVKKVLGLV